jgi:hypothetical protein
MFRSLQTINGGNINTFGITYSKNNTARYEQIQDDNKNYLPKKDRLHKIGPVKKNERTRDMNLFG